MKKYGKAKVPYFFKYVKDKTDNEVEQITDNTINKIVNEINDNKQMFNSISKLGKVDYRVLLKDDNDYSNDKLNERFQKWNKKYGLNLKIDDKNALLNNKNIIAESIKEDLRKEESDEDKIITSLVKYYYGRPSQRKKKLLWYVYGEQLYENLVNNIGERTICHQCGAVVNEKLVRGKCVKCRTKEVNERGYKLIQCIDCGVDVILPRNNKRTCRCEECQKKINQEKWNENNKKWNKMKNQQI